VYPPTNVILMSSLPEAKQVDGIWESKEGSTGTGLEGGGGGRVLLFTMYVVWLR
jgi:hypothetical protein